MKNSAVGKKARGVDYSKWDSLDENEETAAPATRASPTPRAAAAAPATRAGLGPPGALPSVAALPPRPRSGPAHKGPTPPSLAPPSALSPTELSELQQRLMQYLEPIRSPPPEGAPPTRLKCDFSHANWVCVHADPPIYGEERRCGRPFFARVA